VEGGGAGTTRQQGETHPSQIVSEFMEPLQPAGLGHPWRKANPQLSRRCEDTKRMEGPAGCKMDHLWA